MKSRILKYFIVFFILMLFPFCSLANAADMNSIVVLTTQGGVEAPVFDGEILAPGGSVAKTFTVKNNTDKDCSIGLFSLVFNLKNLSGSSISAGYSEFMHGMHLKITTADKLTVLFDGDAAALVNNGDKSCDISLPKGGGRDFIATASLDEAVDNDVQGLNLNFEIIINCTSVDGGTAGTTANNTLIANPRTLDKGIDLLIIGLISAAGLLVVLKVRSNRA